MQGQSQHAFFQQVSAAVRDEKMPSGSAAAKNWRKQCLCLDFLIGRGSHGLRDLALKHEFGLSLAHASASWIL
jgi:hypothetical protein